MSLAWGRLHHKNFNFAECSGGESVAIVTHRARVELSRQKFGITLGVIVTRRRLPWASPINISLLTLTSIT